MTAHNDGSMGAPGTPYDMNGFELVKFKDGKATEHWSIYAMGDAMKMMSPPPPMEMDTTKTK